MTSEVKPGCAAYVMYATSTRGAKPLFHELLCLARVKGATWAVLTPDQHMYVETLDATVNNDVRQVWFRTGADLPPGMKGAEVDAFPTPILCQRQGSLDPPGACLGRDGADSTWCRRCWCDSGCAPSCCDS